jgi:hypothetical protein
MESTTVSKNGGKRRGIGYSFMNILTDELQVRGAEVENWSNVGATAVGCLRQLPMIRRKLVEAVEMSDHLYVLLELGANDRLLGIPAHDIKKALHEMIHAILHIHATPILMEMIPDGIDHSLKKWWEEERHRDITVIRCPNPLRAAMAKPLKVCKCGEQYIFGDTVCRNCGRDWNKAEIAGSRYLPKGHTPTMANQGYMQPDQINYNARAHSAIAHQCLHSLIKAMHLPKGKEKPRKFKEEDEEEENSGDECVLM